MCRMSSVTSFRRLSVDDDRVDAVISHLEGMNTTLKSLRSEGGDLEPFLGSDEVSSLSCQTSASPAAILTLALTEAVQHGRGHQQGLH